MPAVARRASVTLSGQNVKIKNGSAKFTKGGLSGTEVVSDNGVVDTSYENKPCMLEFTLVLTPGHNLEDLRALQDAEGSFTWLDTGDSYALTGMTANDQGSWVEDGDGCPCKFHGNEAQPA